jgi:thioredoxin reductase
MIGKSNQDGKTLDVAVIGGGPAGISACLQLSKCPEFTVALFETDCEIGGTPRSCHFPFGMRDLKRVYTGLGYARKLMRLIQKTTTRIYTDTTVLDIIPNVEGETHLIKISSSQEIAVYKTRYILLATGCCERSRGARLIPGTRPAGIFTTGTFQELVNRHHQRPGNRAVIIGSEHIALSAIVTAKKARMSIAGILEETDCLRCSPVLIRTVALLFHFPVYKGISIRAIRGLQRVSSVEIVLRTGDSSRIIDIPCDTVICTGEWQPETMLIDGLPIRQDPDTFAPIVDEHFKTSIKNIYGAGNVLAKTKLHDLCAIEGRQAAREIMAHARRRSASA